MIIRQLKTDEQYAEASGVSLYDWLYKAETLVLPELPPSAPRRAFLAHCLLTFGAEVEGKFKGCGVAIAAHFQGDPLLQIEQDILRSLMTGFLGSPPQSLECVVGFSADEFSQARVLLAVLCAHDWESQLIVSSRRLVCNVSHDEYIAFYSEDQTVLDRLKSDLGSAGFYLVRRAEVDARLQGDGRVT